MSKRRKGKQSISSYRMLELYLNWMSLLILFVCLIGLLFFSSTNSKLFFVLSNTRYFSILTSLILELLRSSLFGTYFIIKVSLF